MRNLKKNYAIYVERAIGIKMKEDKKLRLRGKFVVLIFLLD